MQALTTHDGVPLKRTLSALNLISLGIGAIIGAGIFAYRTRRRGECRTCDHAILRACAIARAFAGLWTDQGIKSSD